MLYEKIRAIYPQLTEADFRYAIVLQNDGEGDYIKAWRHELPRPNDVQIAAAVPGAAVPAVVSKFQAKAALLQAGLLAQTESLMAQADAVSRLAWDNAQEFRRQSPTVLAMGAALGLDAAALDALFVTAAGIEA